MNHIFKKIIVVMLIIILRQLSSYSLSINELMIITNENSLIIQADLEYLKKFQNDIELAKKMNDPTITYLDLLGRNIKKPIVVKPPLIQEILILPCQRIYLMVIKQNTLYYRLMIYPYKRTICLRL